MLCTLTYTVVFTLATQETPDFIGLSHLSRSETASGGGKLLHLRGPSHGLTVSRSWDGWDALGRLVGRVGHRDHPMFIGLVTTGRLEKGVRVGVVAGPANNFSFAQFCTDSHKLAARPLPSNPDTYGHQI